MTLRDDVLAQIENDDDRRTVGALTDVNQTHLTAREARFWGSSSADEVWQAKQMEATQ